jgi:hypothetical protein
MADGQIGVDVDLIRNGKMKQSEPTRRPLARAWAML